METFVLGTAVKIMAVFADTVSSAKITIIDPYDTTKIDDVSMTASDGNDNIYSYTWQSDDDDDEEGTYIVKIKASNGTYESVFVDYFELKEVD